LRYLSAVRIAITGGIAEGKSTVVAEFARLGMATESADVVARAVFYEPDVQRLLAEAIAQEGDSVTPAGVRSAIAVSDVVRRKVNRVMHPRIRARMDASPALIHEVPLLFEACLYGRYDRVYVVTCGDEVQLRRLTERLGDSATARAIIASQLPTGVKIAFADGVIRTDRSMGELLEHIDRLAAELYG